MLPKNGNNSNRFLVVSHLERSILTGQHKPGERLLEIALARELGVSQGSIREALAELEMRGLVIKYPNRGTYVVELDAKGVRDCFQVRNELEPLACELLAHNLTAEVAESLRQKLQEIRVSAAAEDYPTFQNAILQFHMLIWSAQPNRLIEKFLNMACLPLFAYDQIRRYAHAYTNYDRVIKHHEQLLTALLMSEGELAARLMHRFLRQWLREDLNDYARLNSEPEPQMVVESALPTERTGNMGRRTRNIANPERRIVRHAK